MPEYPDRPLLGQPEDHAKQSPFCRFLGDWQVSSEIFSVFGSAMIYVLRRGSRTLLLDIDNPEVGGYHLFTKSGWNTWSLKCEFFLSCHLFPHRPFFRPTSSTATDCRSMPSKTPFCAGETGPPPSECHASDLLKGRHRVGLEV